MLDWVLNTPLGDPLNGYKLYSKKQSNFHDKKRLSKNLKINLWVEMSLFSQILHRHLMIFDCVLCLTQPKITKHQLSFCTPLKASGNIQNHDIS